MRRTGIELIVIGSRGHGASETLFGCVATGLVGASDIPVFLGPRVPRRKEEQS